MVSLPIAIPSGFTVIVKEADTVTAGQVLAHRDTIAEHRINISQVLHISPHKVFSLLQKHPGDSIKEGDILAIQKKSMGFSAVKLRSNISGLITGFDADTGELILGGQAQHGEKEIVSPIAGTVSSCNNEQIVLSADAENVVQGTQGRGGTAQGTLSILPDITQGASAQQLSLLINQSVANTIVLGKELSKDALIKIIGIGSKGIVACSIDPNDLDYLAARNMMVPIVLVDESKLKVLSQHQGKLVALDGTAYTVTLLG